MEDLKEKFLQLLNSPDRANVEIALKMVEGMPALLPLFREYVVLYKEAYEWAFGVLMPGDAVAGFDEPVGFDESARFVDGILKINACTFFSVENKQPVPGSIKLFGSCEVLHLVENGISSLPPEIGQLKNLKDLQLNYNQLTSLPDEIGRLQNLENIAIIDNRLRELPIALGQCKNLQRIWVGNMKVSDESIKAIYGMLPDCAVYITEAAEYM